LPLVTRMLPLPLLSTAKIKENILFMFYKFLSLSNINNLNDDIIEKVDLLNSQNINKKSKKISPFDMCPDIVISYPKQLTNSQSVLKDMPEEIWNLFVEYAEEYYPNIAIGVIITICSGIRRGGCVNLRVKDVKLHKQNHMLYLNIKDNQYELFGDRDINLNNSQVKKPRQKQPVLPLHSRIVEIFETHKKYLRKIYNSRYIKNKALFVNAYGLPMSGDSFSNYFNNLKHDFIKFLENEGLPALAQQMKEYRWGTHIGRHIFTNTIVKKGYANGSGNKPIPKLVALLRGDSSEESSMVYIDEYTLSEAVSKNINDISNIAMGYNKNEND
jgi:integrase